MKKTIKTALVIIILLFSVLICLKPQGIMLSEADGSKKDSVTVLTKAVIHYYIWGDEESYVRPVVEAYEALNHNIDIRLHVVSGDVYDDELYNILSGDDPVDLVGVRDTSQLVSLAEQEKIMDMTSYIRSKRLDVRAYGNMFNEIVIDGKYYGIPVRSTCWILLYNKDIFKKLGISYPGQLTWEEYGDLAVALTRKEENIYGGYWPPWCYNFAALQSSEYLVDDELRATRESLLMLHQFYEEDGSHYSYLESYNQTRKLSELFCEGNIAMMPQGEWMINMILENEKNGKSQVDWGVAPMPVLDPGNAGATWGQYQFAAVSAKTSCPEAVFDFLEFLCGEEGARIYAQRGIVHAYETDEIREIYAQTVGEEAALVIYEAKRKQEQLAILHYHELITLFEECAHDFLSGEITIDQAMDKFVEKRKVLYQK